MHLKGSKKILANKWFSETFISKNILTITRRIKLIVKTVKVSNKGQISIPLEIREKSGINKGDELMLMQEGKRILIESAGNAGKKLEDDFSDLLKLSEKSLFKLWDNKEDQIWNKYLKK